LSKLFVSVLEVVLTVLFKEIGQERSIGLEYIVMALESAVMARVG